MRAVRSTLAGAAAQFNVRLGSGTGAGAGAAVRTVTPEITGPAVRKAA